MEFDKKEFIQNLTKLFIYSFIGYCISTFCFPFTLRVDIGISLLTGFILGFLNAIYSNNKNYNLNVNNITVSKKEILDGIDVLRELLQKNPDLKSETKELIEKKIVDLLNQLTF